MTCVYKVDSYLTQGGAARKEMRQISRVEIGGTLSTHPIPHGS